MGLGKHELRYSSMTVFDISESLATDYLDLYLIHNPPQGTKARLEMWEALIDAKKSGKVRSIGVSN